MAENRARALCHSVVAMLALIVMVVGADARGREAGTSETRNVDQLRADLVLTFARFVEWPPQAFSATSAPIIVGIIADEAVALALETSSRGKNVAGRMITVKRLQWDSDIAGVHMLFIGESEKRRLKVVIERVRLTQIVTVSSLPEFGRAGGIITLTLTNGRMGFAVNSHAAALGDVHLSSFLLSHATKVSDESGAGVR